MANLGTQLPRAPAYPAAGTCHTELPRIRNGGSAVIGATSSQLTVAVAKYDQRAPRSDGGGHDVAAVHHPRGRPPRLRVRHLQQMQQDSLHSFPHQIGSLSDEASVSNSVVDVAFEHLRMQMSSLSGHSDHQVAHFLMLTNLMLTNQPGGGSL